MRTRFSDLLGIEAPIVCAPMGGGPGTPALAAAVSDAGGLGSVAGGYLTAPQLAAEIDAVRTVTSKPFAVNVFATAAPRRADASPVIAVVNRLRAEVGLGPLADQPAGWPALDDQLDVLVEAAPAAVSFTFGPPDTAVVDRLHDGGVVVIATATSTAEARELDRRGVDVVCAQSLEAGAHSGGFDGAVPPQLGALALVPQVADATTRPVLAAGAVMDGRGLAAALALGAAGVQCGTAFLLAREAGTSGAHRRAVATATETVLTRAVTGRYARAIPNALVAALEPLDGPGLPDYPITHALTAELRRVAAEHGRRDLMALWCGQGSPLARRGPARGIVRRMLTDAAAVLSALCAHDT